MSTTDAVDVSISMSLHLGDWLRETGHLSPTELGTHMRLVVAAWCRAGHLPGDPARLCRLAGVDSGEWAAIWTGISDLWTTTDDGRIHHARTLAELQRARAAKTSLSARGRAGRAAQLTGRAVAGLTPATGRADAGQPPPPPDPDPDPDPDPEVCPVAVADARPGRARAHADRARTPEADAFARVWTAYPRHDARARASAEWTRQSRAHVGGVDGLADAVTAALGWQIPSWRASDREYPAHVPMLSTYLRGARWTDERTSAPVRTGAPKPVIWGRL